MIRDEVEAIIRLSSEHPDPAAVRGLLEAVLARIMRDLSGPYVRILSPFPTFSEAFVSGETLFALATNAVGGKRAPYTFYIPAKAYVLLVGLLQADARTFGVLSWELG